MSKFKRGDKVIVASGHEGIVQECLGWDKTLYEVRLWEGLRHVGDIVQSESELKKSEVD